MKPCHCRKGISLLLAVASVIAATHHCFAEQKKTLGIDAAQQVPKWSAEDLSFFMHGSMSTEVVPESVLRAFI